MEVSFHIAKALLMNNECSIFLYEIEVLQINKGYLLGARLDVVMTLICKKKERYINICKKRRTFDGNHLQNNNQPDEK